MSITLSAEQVEKLQKIKKWSITGMMTAAGMHENLTYINKLVSEILADLAMIDAALGESKPKVPRRMIRQIMDEAIRTGSMHEAQEIVNSYGFEVDDSEDKA